MKTEIVIDPAAQAPNPQIGFGEKFRKLFKKGKKNNGKKPDQEQEQKQEIIIVDQTPAPVPPGGLLVKFGRLIKRNKNNGKKPDSEEQNQIVPVEQITVDPPKKVGLMDRIKFHFTTLKNKYSLASNLADQKLYWDYVARQITPATIKEEPDCIIINNKLLARTVIAGIPPTSDIGGYPADMKDTVVDELLAISSTGYSIAFSYTVIPVPNVEAMKMLDQAIFNNKVAQEGFRDKGKDGYVNPLKQPPLKYGLEAQDFADNYREVYKNTQKMYHTAFIIVIWGKTIDDLREAEGHVSTVLESNRIYYEIPDFRHLQTFLAAQPYPNWVQFSWCELFSHHAAALFPTRNPNSHTDDIGLYFGEDMKTGKVIQINLAALAAQHLMFVGPTGSGKTFTLLMLLMRSFDMLGKRIIYTTPKADVGTNYRNVAQYYGILSTIIDIGPRGKNINPLQILYDETMLKDELDYMHCFDEHMELLDQFFTVLFEGSKTINMSNYLNESLIQVYREKGILRDDPSTWKNANWPTMLDLRHIWVTATQIDPKDTTAKALVDKTYMVNTAWSYMNRPTDINTSADFIIIDLSGVPASLQEAMNVFVTGIMAMRFKTDISKETIIAVDEGAVFLRNPKLSLFLLRTLTQGRSYKISLWFITQQPDDLVKAGVESEFKTNIQISIVLGNMRKDTIAHVQTFYSLNDQNVSDLMACGVGEGLLIVGNEVIPTKFVPTQHEIDVIKGKNIKTIDAEIKERLSLFSFVHEGLNNLVKTHEIIDPEWISQNEIDTSVLTREGYQRFKIHRIDGRPGVAWLKNVINGMVGNQSTDHYATVLRIAAWFVIHDCKPQVNHNDDVDILVEVNGKKVAIEYERPGSHNFDELVEKRQRAEKIADIIIFVCQQANLLEMSKAVGESLAVPRGIELISRLDSLLPAATHD